MSETIITSAGLFPGGSSQDAVNTASIIAEVSRAQGVENALSVGLNAETVRSEAAEAILSAAVGSLETATSIPSLATALGVGTALSSAGGFLSVVLGTTGTTAAAGNDTRIVNAAQTPNVYTFLTNIAAIATYAGNSPAIRVAGLISPSDGGGAFYTQTNTGWPTAGISDGSGRLWYLSDLYNDLGNMAQVCQPGVDLSTQLPAFATWLNSVNKGLRTPTAPAGSDWIVTQPMLLHSHSHIWEKGSRVLFQPAVSSFSASFSAGVMTVTGAVTGAALLPGVPLYNTGQTPCFIQSQLTNTSGGAAGGAGTYQVSKSFTKALATITAAGVDSVAGITSAITYDGINYLENSCVVGPDGTAPAPGAMSSSGWMLSSALNVTGTQPAPNQLLVNTANCQNVIAGNRIIGPQAVVIPTSGPAAGLTTTPLVQVLSVGSETITVGGTASAGDTISITATGSYIAGSPITVTTAAITAGQTTAQIAALIRTALLANSAFAGFSITVSGSVITLAYLATGAYGVTWSSSVSGSATETIAFAASSGTAANPLVTLNASLATFTGTPSFTFDNYPNYNAFAPGVAGITFAGGCKPEIVNDTSQNCKFPLVYNTDGGHTILRNPGAAGVISGLYVQTDGGDNRIEYGGMSGGWAAISIGNSNSTNSLSISLGGFDVVIEQTQLSFLSPIGIAQISQNGLMTGNGLSKGLNKVRFESVSERAIWLLPGATTHLTIADVKLNWASAGTSNLPSTLISNVRSAAFSLGVVTGLTVSANDGLSAFTPDNTGSGNYAQFTFYAEGGFNNSSNGSFDPRFLGVPNNLGTIGSRWMSTPSSIDVSTKDDWGKARDLAWAGNLLKNPEINTNWTVLNGSISVAASVPYASSAISVLPLPQFVVDALGPNPTVIAITSTGSGNILLPAAVTGNPIGVNTKLHTRAFFVQATSFQISPNLRFGSTLGTQVYSAGNFAPGVNNFYEYLGVDKTPAFYGDATGNLYGLAIGFISAGTLYVLGVQAGLGELMPYNPAPGPSSKLPLKLPVYTVAQLTAMVGYSAGTEACVSDATAPTYNGALTGGGTVFCRALFNGTAWQAG